MTFEVNTIQIALFPIRFSLPKNIGGPSEGRSNGALLCRWFPIVALHVDLYLEYAPDMPYVAARATRLHLPLRRRGNHGGSGGARWHRAACARAANVAAGTGRVLGGGLCVLSPTTGFA